MTQIQMGFFLLGVVTGMVIAVMIVAYLKSR
jgi:hypothetical protein